VALIQLGGINSFIVPEDNELSIRYLKWVYQNAKSTEFTLNIRQKEPNPSGKEGNPRQRWKEVPTHYCVLHYWY
jgi:hypothetical protein